jgi:hypothetical protein
VFQEAFLIAGLKTAERATCLTLYKNDVFRFTARIPVIKFNLQIYVRLLASGSAGLPNSISVERNHWQKENGVAKFRMARGFQESSRGTVVIMTIKNRGERSTLTPYP